MGINWMQALMAGGADAAFSIAGGLQKQQDALQKQQLMEAQAKIEQQKLYTMESLKAPAEHTITVDDQTAPSGKASVVQQWQMPTMDGTPGSYKEISRTPIPINYQRDDHFSVGNGQEQTAFFDPNNLMAKPILQGSPRPIFDPESHFHPMEVHTQDVNGNPITKVIDARSGKTIESFVGAPAGGGANGGYGTHEFTGPDNEAYVGTGKIDPQGIFHPATTASGIPLAGPKFNRDFSDTGNTRASADQLASFLKPPATSPDGMTVQQDAFSSPLGQLNAPAGVNPNVRSAPMASGGGGSMAPSPAVPAKGTMGPGGAAPKTIIATGIDRNTGQKFVKYSDGTVAPAP